MKKLLALFCALSLLLTACGGPGAPGAAPTATPEVTPAAGGEDDAIRILATTYPLYLFTTAVTEGVSGVTVDLLVNQQTSCLHDYTLTVNDMKAIEGADIIVMNGAGLEDFMDAALAHSDAEVIDCSQEIELLPALGHKGHGHDTEYDPHVWMDPNRAIEMMGTLALALTDQTGLDFHNSYCVAKEKLEWSRQRWEEQLDSLSGAELITFHDGFQYFADSFGLNLVKSIEEEEGSEASAAEIKEIVALVGESDIPAIFTERNGSDATAKAIARETGCAVYELDMIMSGAGTGIQPYIDAMEQNVGTILEALE